MPRVVLLRCESYDFDKVEAVVERGIEMLGGAEVFVREGEKLLLKPNLLSADPPEKCVTTHPSVFKAVAGVFKKAGAVLTYGDSPAFHSPAIAARKAGIADVASELGITLADFKNGREVSFSEGIQNKKMTIANGVLESDGLISISKLKTHGFAKMTGAVKNQFGCIPGTLKGEFHVKLPDINNFAKMLIDINRYVKPRLYVMDGIIGMDGNGPRGGNPKRMNAILFSSDPIALDATVCRMVNLDPELVPAIIAGKEAGLGTYLENEIELLGEKIENFFDSGFVVGRQPLTPYKQGRALGLVRNALVPKPVIDPNKCKICGICVNMCPVTPKAVNWHDGNKKKAPTHIYKGCIRCFCCQELCPENAITIKVPPVRKVLNKIK